MKPLIAFCVAGAAGLWIWALFGPVPDPPKIPDRWVGRFAIVGFEPPIDKNGDRVPANNPFPPGQTRIFHFRADGTYLLTVGVSGGYEMMRQEGTLEVLADDVLLMTQYSENRTKPKQALPPFRWKATWTRDGNGRLLQFIRVLEEKEKKRLSQGEELYLRPVEKKQ